MFQENCFVSANPQLEKHFGQDDNNVQCNGNPLKNLPTHVLITKLFIVIKTVNHRFKIALEDPLITCVHVLFKYKSKYSSSRIVCTLS